MSDKLSINSKLDQLLSYYTDLKELAAIPMETYLYSSIYRRASERNLQLIVECAAEINNILLKMHEKKECTYPYQSFIDLAELNVFPLEFALLIAPSAELSNRLMFDYEEIDDKLVYHSVSSHLEHYLKYMYYINQYLKRT